MNYYKLDKKKLEYVSISSLRYATKTIILMVFVFIMTLVFYPTIEEQIEAIPIKLLNQKEALNKDNVISKIKELHLDHPDIVFAQSVQEASYNGKLFNSNICRNNHNLFGMKRATQRPTTAVSTELNHAYYVDWQSSIIDYSLWQSAYGRNLTQRQYLDLLDEIYCENDSSDLKYSDKIIKIMNQY